MGPTILTHPRVFFVENLLASTFWKPHGLSRPVLGLFYLNNMSDMRTEHFLFFFPGKYLKFAKILPTVDCGL